MDDGPVAQSCVGKLGLEPLGGTEIARIEIADLSLGRRLVAYILDAGRTHSLLPQPLLELGGGAALVGVRYLEIDDARLDLRGLSHGGILDRRAFGVQRYGVASCGAEQLLLP